MAARLNFLITFGHGDGDPGAVGQGTNERDFNRKVLYPYLKKWSDKSQHNFDYYDITGNKDMFQDTAKGWGMYSINPKYYSSVTEIHEDAASATATGGHNIVSSSFKADKNDLSLAQTIKKIVGWWGSVANSQGISYRNNLLNLNVAAQRGINYRLMELGFITNKSDMDKIKANLDSYAKGIIEGITGETFSAVAPTPAPAPIENKEFHTTVARYKALKDSYFYLDKELTRPSRVNFVKGQFAYADEIVIETGRDGKKYYRGKWVLGKSIVYFSLNKSVVSRA